MSQAVSELWHDPPVLGFRWHLYVRLKWFQRSLAGVSVYRRLRGTSMVSVLGAWAVDTPGGFGAATFLFMGKKVVVRGREKQSVVPGIVAES